MELTAGQREALDNLDRKAKGEDVGWINIADARALAEKGLCDRDRQGWCINPQGSAWLAGAVVSPPASSAFQAIPIRSSGHRS